jgi:hypothetical protein
MATQAAAWGGAYLLDRDSEFVDSDGNRTDWDNELTAAVRAYTGLAKPRQRSGNRNDRTQPETVWRQFLQELLPDLGISNMDDLDTVSLTELLQGILS